MPKKFNPEELAYAIAGLVLIEKDPESWNQAQWRCETGGCYAYEVSSAAGSEWYREWDEGGKPGEMELMAPDKEKGWPLETAMDRACRILGLQPYIPESEALFDGTNTLHDLETVVHHLAAGTLPEGFENEFARLDNRDDTLADMEETLDDLEVD